MDVDRRVGDAEHMPARWYSVQWVSVRIVWALFAVGVLTRNIAPGDEFLIGGLVVGVIVFVALTLVAHRDRRIWAREHQTPYPGTDRQR